MGVEYTLRTYISDKARKTHFELEMKDCSNGQELDYLEGDNMDDLGVMIRECGWTYNPRKDKLIAGNDCSISPHRGNGNGDDLAEIADRTKIEDLFRLREEFSKSQ